MCKGGKAIRTSISNFKSLYTFFPTNQWYQLRGTGRSIFSYVHTTPRVTRIILLISLRFFFSPCGLSTARGVEKDKKPFSALCFRRDPNDFPCTLYAAVPIRAGQHTLRRTRYMRARYTYVHFIIVNVSKRYIIIVVERLRVFAPPEDGFAFIKHNNNSHICTPRDRRDDLLLILNSARMLLRLQLFFLLFRFIAK